MRLTKDQLHMLRHMLGINTPEDRTPRPYRNYAAVNPGDAFFLELEQIGAVEKCHGVPLGQYECYRCTGKGRQAAMKSHKDIRLPRSKRRYKKFLSILDCVPDITFHDFLTDPEYKELRKGV